MQRPPAPLTAALIARFPPIADEQAPVLPVRDGLAGDLRFFLIAWALGFVAFFALIA